MSSSLPCLPLGWRWGWGQRYGRFLWVPGVFLASAADGPSAPWWVPTVHCWRISERCGGRVSAGLLELGCVPGGYCHRPLLPVTHPGCSTPETLCFPHFSICPGFLCDLCLPCRSQGLPRVGSECSTPPLASPRRAGILGVSRHSQAEEGSVQSRCSAH